MSKEGLDQNLLYEYIEQLQDLLPQEDFKESLQEIGIPHEVNHDNINLDYGNIDHEDTPTISQYISKLWLKLSMVLLG